MDISKKTKLKPEDFKKGFFKRHYQMGRYIEKHLSRFVKIRECVREGMRILDIGCGMAIPYEGIKVELTGIDRDETSLSEAKLRNPQGEFIQGNENMTESLPDNEYDLVVATEFVEHIKNFHPLLREMERVCKKGGMIVITLPKRSFGHGHFHPVWGKEDVEKLVDCFNCVDADVSSIFRHDGIDWWWLIKIKL